jgi:tetratricopeptide (TPR) repeat protein
VATTIVAGCRSAQTPSKNVAGESISSIVSEIQLEKDRDVYRLPYPRDAEGRNLYESSLDRLDQWSRLHPNETAFLDIVWFARGICHEKLGQLDEAQNAFTTVFSGAFPSDAATDRETTSEMADQELRLVAREHAEVMADLNELFRPPLQVPATEDFTPEEAARARAEKAVEKYKGTEWESLALLLAENQAVEHCAALRSSRGTSGEAAYREAIEESIVRFSESKRIHSHWMRLGLHYEQVMREWVTRAEYGNEAKSWKLAEEALNKASEIYLKVSQADGYPEKREAQAKLLVLEETAQKIETHLK